MEKEQRLRDRGIFISLINNVTKSIRESFDSVLSALDKKVFRIRIENEKYFVKALEKTAESVEKAGNSIRELKLAENLDKVQTDLIHTISSNSVQGFSVQNIDTLNVDNLSQEQVVAKLEELNKKLANLDSVATNIKALAGKKDVVLPQMPKEMEVYGEVGIDSLPEKLYTQFNELKSEIKGIVASIQGIRIESPKQKEVVIPDSFTVKNMDKFEQALKELQNVVKDLPKKMPVVEFPDTINVGNFPPTKTPQPVTSININPLRGTAVTTSVTVGNSATALPATPQAYRRAIIIFNNDATKTLYLGGSDVTVATGIPVVAQSFSPAIDAGPRLLLYGIVDAGSIDVRVLEASNENIGG